MRLTLRTLLAYLDDTLQPAEAAEIGRKLTANAEAKTLVDRIRTVARRRSVVPPTGDANGPADYLSDALVGDDVSAFETACLADDAALAEVAACHQVLTLVLSEQVKVPPTARSRMYALVKGREAVPGRKPAAGLSVATVRDADPAADAEADAQLLLGLPAYSAGESGGRRAAWLGTAAALLAGFGVCAWAAWPAADTDPPAVKAFVLNDPTPPPAPTAEKQPATIPQLATIQPPTTAPPLAAVPAKPEKPAPPNADRLAVGQVDKPAGGAVGLVVRRTAGADAWERVGPGAGGVSSGDRLVCLPGYRAAVRFDSGATADLWGNLPDLLPVPLLEAAVTPAVPADGFHADLTVHAGRVYLGSKQPGGVTVRLRFAGQVWDVALPDDKAEVVFELVGLPTPGEQPALPVRTARLVTLAGSVSVTPAGEPAVPLEKAAGVTWVSGGPTQKLPPLGRPERDQLARLGPTPPGAQPTLTALGDLSRRAGEGGAVAALLDELVQAVPENRGAAAAVVAGNRVGVYGLAALGRADKLADLLAGTANPVSRQLAAEALVPALATDPELVGPARKVLVEQKGLAAAEADEVFRLLRGVSVAERGDPATLDRLLDDLLSPALPLRELALSNLIGLTPAEDRSKVTAPPFVYDVAAPEADREASQKAWKGRVEAMKKKMPKG